MAAKPQVFIQIQHSTYYLVYSYLLCGLEFRITECAIFVLCMWFRGRTLGHSYISSLLWTLLSTSRKLVQFHCYPDSRSFTINVGWRLCVALLRIGTTILVHIHWFGVTPSDSAIPTSVFDHGLTLLNILQLVAKCASRDGDKNLPGVFYQL